jgi:hypothetical protein
MSTLIRWIQVSFQKEGIHKWPDAVNHKGVEFLAYPHRHMFHFYVKLQVEHNDREVEFILFKRWLESLYEDSVLALDYKSCEMIAEELIEKIQEKYPARRISVSVFEDNENGAVLETWM